MIPNTVSAVQYAGNGAATQFAFGNKVFAPTDLVVTLIANTTGIGALLNYLTDYTVTNVDVDTGCTVVTTVAPAAGFTLDIRTLISLVQLTSVKNQGRFLPELHEEFFDRATRELQDLTRRAVTFSIRSNDLEIVPWPPMPAPAARKGFAIIFDPITGLPTVGLPSTVTYTPNTLGQLLFPQTSAEVTAGVTPTLYQYQEGDIRRYGATTGSGDNSLAINAALLVSADGGNAAFIPGGNWVITSTLNATGGSSMYGVGQASRLIPTGCNGITFGTQGTYEGTRFFRDFEMNAVSGTAATGILCDFSAVSGNRITQVAFSRLTIQNFMQGVYAHGMWNCVFEDCWLYNNYQGYWFYGQSIQCQILGGFTQKGSLTGSGTQIGLNVTTNTPTNNESCQSLKATNWGVYAYDINVNLALAQYTMLEHCDISVANITGVNIVSCSGGTIVRDCWIQTNSASATTGIALPALGAAINDKVVIDGNTIICNLANAGSIGVSVSNNHNSVAVTNNTIGTITQPWAQALVNNNCNNTIFKYNTIYASSVAVSIHSSSVGAELGPNVVQNGTQVYTAGTPAGFTFYGAGSYTLNLSGISGVTATVTWVANGKSVRHTLPSTGATGANSGGAATLVSTGDIPAIILPLTTRGGILRVLSNSVNVIGFFGLTNAGVLTIFADVTGANFPATLNRGILDSWGYELV